VQKCLSLVCLVGRPFPNSPTTPVGFVISASRYSSSWFFCFRYGDTAKSVSGCLPKLLKDGTVCCLLINHLRFCPHPSPVRLPCFNRVGTTYFSVGTALCTSVCLLVQVDRFPVVMVSEHIAVVVGIILLGTNCRLGGIRLCTTGRVFQPDISSGCCGLIPFRVVPLDSVTGGHRGLPGRLV
jgi:hypothetical protein